jgi:hypothetical protein
MSTVEEVSAAPATTDSAAPVAPVEAEKRSAPETEDAVEVLHHSISYIELAELLMQFAQT